MEQASKSNNFHYNPNLKVNASSLRSEMTKSEAVLWKHALSKGKLFGFGFNRQRPILNYIVDFMSKDLLLVIEIDGVSHLFTDISEKDVVRQQELEAVGFKVIRYSASEVLRNVKGVSSSIQENIRARSEELGLGIID